MTSREPETLYGPASSIVITGASSGIGAALAEHLASYGGKIALFARRAERLAEVAERVRSAGGQPFVVCGDVADPAAVAAAHRDVVAAQGPVDVAFLNAGVGTNVQLAAFDGARVRETFATNVIGVVNWLEVLLPSMVERRSGTIVGVSSLAALRGLPGSSSYSASKAAVSTLLEALRVEAAAYEIQISIVEPGFIRSEMTDRNKYRMPFFMETEPAVRQIAEAVAEGRGRIRFPWQLATMVSVFRLLPQPLYEWVGGRMAKQLRRKVDRRRDG